ncbi:phage baseplate assembly protein V [Sinomicrobium kalidii]|uniref:phage baseplate assembly protein V n=1 Tax=Sinomicrobium kalidii TaxID=2900738 RepID=UPI001E4F070F|nr:phage baseplate assembly protein V [Sinomicrobium kalidii]UGU15195.1 phage baseplate assembly protein V [Sinomicrobium kalidii]
MQVSSLNGVVNDFLQKKVTIQIEGFDASVVYYDLELKESMASHQEFRFTWQADGNFMAGHEQQMETIADYRGKEILISFKNTLGQETHRFIGIIEGLYLQDEDGGVPGYTVIGRSRSIVLDDIPQSRTYIREGLQEILHTVASQAPNNFKIDLNPRHSGAISYTTQYNETDFAFMQRMARRYGEWFYYDGAGLQFGKTHATDITLVNGANLRLFVPGGSIAPGKVNLTGYNYQQAATFTEQWQRPQQNSDNFLSRTALDSAATTYGRQNRDYQYVAQARDSMELREMQQLFQQANEAKMATYAGHSDTPLPIGGRITIQKGKAIGEFIVIEVKHRSELKGHYTCAFTVIPADISVPTHTDPFIIQKAESQRALVVANNDPQSMKRVKVQFYWGYESDWIPVVTLYGGSGRGIYILPEVGDEVSVDFEGGNVDQPIVRGAVYNGAQKNGYGSANNDLKVFHFRNGEKIIVNEAEGSIEIVDKAGSTYYMDGSGNIDITAVETIRQNARNMEINILEDLTITTGDQLQIRAFQKMLITTPWMQQLIADFYHTQAGKALINSENEIKLESPELFASGQEKLMLHSEKELISNSKGTLSIKGEKGNKMYNTAESYEIVQPTIEAKCVVSFRAKDSWSGEFGFDWMRIEDTNIDGDNKYEDIVGQYGSVYATQSNAVFTANASKYNSLKTRHYTPHKIPWKTDNNGDTEEYFVPWLSLFPTSVNHQPPPIDSSLEGAAPIVRNYEPNEATLKVSIEVEEEPESIELEYDESLFTITNKERVNQTAKGKHDAEITIKCTGDFGTHKEIKAMAVTEVNGKKVKQLAGKLKVYKNQKLYNGDVVFVNVKTKINSREKFGLSNTTIIKRQKDYLEKFIKQALIIPNIDVQKFDRTNDSTLNSSYTHQLGPNKVLSKYHNSGQGSGLADYMETEFNAAHPEYADYYKVFFFGEPGIAVYNGQVRGLGGHANGIPSKTAIMYANPDDFFVTHELMHCLGMYHSFDNSGDYTYEIGKTENIMDYSHMSWNGSTILTQISTWKWQWEKLQNEIG